MENNKKRQVLSCCLEDSAFILASQRINAENDITYDNLKAALAEALSAEDYKRTLETKLRNLKFTKRTNINLFCNSLRTLIRELHNLTDLDETSIDAIAINHVIAQLDKQVRQDVKMLQLADNKSLERLLELVNDKLSGNPLFSNYVQVSAAEHSRLDKMESLIEKLVVKVDALSTTSKARVTCANSGKSNHSKDNYFKLKTCFKCKKRPYCSFLQSRQF